MNKENNTVIENEVLNEVNIFDEVLQSIAAHSVKELKGVSLSTSLAEGIMEKIVKKSSAPKAVKVDMKDKNVSLDVHISVEHGLKIQDVCAALQADIKKDIESVTDLTIDKVNIFVDNITIETEEKKPAIQNNTEETEN